MLEPNFSLSWLPQIDSGNKYLTQTKPLSITDKVLINSLLVLLFWVQHSIMARGAFKTFMNTLVTNNTYYFYEKGMFALTTGIMVFAVIIFH